MNNARLNQLRSRITPIAGVAALCVVGAVVASALSLIRLAGTAASRTSEAASQTGEQRQLDQFAADLKRFESQTNGRSVFLTPRRPHANDTVVDTSTTEPTRPTRYAGPSIIAMINGAVWFADGQRIEPGKDGRGVTVVSLNAPWSARILWQGVEFDVGLFERDSVVYRSASANSANWVAPTTPMATQNALPPIPPRAATSTHAGTTSPGAPGNVQIPMPPGGQPPRIIVSPGGRGPGEIPMGEEPIRITLPENPPPGGTPPVRPTEPGEPNGEPGNGQPATPAPAPAPGSSSPAPAAPSNALGPSPAPAPSPDTPPHAPAQPEQR